MRDCLQCGNHPKGHADDRRDGEGEHEHRSVEPNVAGAGQVWRTESDERANAGRRDEHSTDAAKHREKEALGEQLPNESTAARAERRPQREFATPLNAPREQEVRHIDARDDEDEHHRRENGKQRRLDARASTHRAWRVLRNASSGRRSPDVARRAPRAPRPRCRPSPARWRRRRASRAIVRR